MVDDGSSRAPDPRPARTRAALFGAVERLTLSGSEITIGSVTRAAGVSRSAFYAQFTGLDDLAAGILTAAFAEIARDDLVGRAASAGRTDLARRAALRLLEHIEGRRGFYRASLEWMMTARVHELVVDEYARHVRATATTMPDVVPDGIRVDDVARYVGGGTLALVRGWVEDPEPAGVEVMAERLLAVWPDWLVGR